MNSNSHFQSLVVDIAHEHRDLQNRLRQLRQLAHDSIPDNAKSQRLSKIGTMLLALRRQMERHFAKEVAGGVMEEAVARLPRLAEEGARIEHEHPELLRLIDEAIRLVEVTSPSAADWEQTHAAVDAFVTKMLAHESAENRLLQRGFNQDFELLQ